MYKYAWVSSSFELAFGTRPKPIYEGEKNTRRGGWIVLAFSSFPPTEVTGQKQLEYSF